MGERKLEIAEQIAALSRLLGMIPSDDTIKLNQPMTDDSMAFTEWIEQTRNSFMKLSVLVGKELDIQLQ